MRSILHSELCNYDSVMPQAISSDITPFSDEKQELVVEDIIDNNNQEVIKEMRTPEKKHT
jgi:hypothetical protein